MCAAFAASAWVIFSFLAHSLAKYYFQFVSRLCDGDAVTMTVAAMLVTGVQLLCCGLLALVKVPKPDTEKGEEPSFGVVFMVAISHAFGALTTNYSMALIPAASTHFIKVMEPMVTGGIAWLTVGVTISKPKLLALVLVIIGTVGVTRNPFSTLPNHGLGVQLAFLSNLLYAARNVTIKHLLGRNVVFDAATMGKVSILGAIVFLPAYAVAYMLLVSESILQLNMVMVAILGGCALCRATYTYISTSVILQYISVIGHAVASLGKHVLVIVLLYLFGQRYYLSPTFVLVCVLGLLVYIKGSQGAAHKISHAEEIDTSLRKPRVMVLVLIVMTVALVTLRVSASIHNRAISTAPEHITRRLIDQPNNTDCTMKSKLTASSAVQEAQKIQLQIYKELIGDYKKAILVGLVDDENRGDSAINVGEFEALEKLGIEIIFYCSITECGNFKTAKEAISRVTEPVVVLTTGGGNFCVYESQCSHSERLVSTFPDHEVLAFPQSANSASTQRMKAHADIMNKHPNITYLFRDRRSYNTIVNSGMFKYKTAVLCPDAAMQIGIQQPPIEPTHDIVFLKRRDKESLHLKMPNKFPANLSIVVGDWSRHNNRSPRGSDIKEISYKHLMIGLKHLSRGKVIISDRLHAHILSVLLGKPNVMIDNSYKKVSSFHNTWTPSVENVLFASNVTDAIEKAQYLLHKYY